MVLPRVPRVTGPKYSNLFGWPNRADAARIATAFNARVKAGIAGLGLDNDATFTLCHTDGYPANPWIHVWMDAGRDDADANFALRQALARLACESPQTTDPVRLGAVSIDQVRPALEARADIVILDATLIYLCDSAPAPNEFDRDPTEGRSSLAASDVPIDDERRAASYTLDGIQFKPGEFERLTRSDLFRDSTVKLKNLDDRYVLHEADGNVAYLLLEDSLVEVIVNGRYNTGFLGIASGSPERVLGTLGFELIRHEDAGGRLWSYWAGPGRKPVAVVSREYGGDLLEVYYTRGPLQG